MMAKQASSAERRRRAAIGRLDLRHEMEGVNLRRTTWRYIKGGNYINLIFKGDKLDSKDTNLGTQ